MATAAQVLANRANAQHSTGPRTEEGKDRSRRNGLQHGLTSAAVLLPWEDKDDYAALHAAFENDHRPGSDLERELLHAMADCWWRLERARRVETEFLASREAAVREAGVSASGDQALVLLFTDPEEMKKMRLMMRYVASAEKAWNKAAADFEKARREHNQRQREEAAVELSGFASQPCRLIPTPDNADAILSTPHAQAYLKTASATVDTWTPSASS